MKKTHILLICICLVLTSCANGKKKKGFILRNTLSSELSESIIKICSVDKMDEMSTLMIPVKGFYQNLKTRVSQKQIDSTMNTINYPINIYLDSFFDFDPACKSTPRISLKELRTYGDHTSYGMGTFSVSYKIEAILEESNLIQKYYAGASKSENLGMFSSSKKSVDYQSAALTSAFYELYKTIYDDIN